jgi:hypothetical protein
LLCYELPVDSFAEGAKQCHQGTTRVLAGPTNPPTSLPPEYHHFAIPQRLPNKPSNFAFFYLNHTGSPYLRQDGAPHRPLLQVCRHNWPRLAHCTSINCTPPFPYDYRSPHLRQSDLTDTCNLGCLILYIQHRSPISSPSPNSSSSRTILRLSSFTDSFHSTPPLRCLHRRLHRRIYTCSPPC